MNSLPECTIKLRNDYFLEDGHQLDIPDIIFRFVSADCWALVAQDTGSDDTTVRFNSYTDEHDVDSPIREFVMDNPNVFWEQVTFLDIFMFGGTPFKVSIDLHGNISFWGSSGFCERCPEVIE